MPHLSCVTRSLITEFSWVVFSQPVFSDWNMKGIYSQVFVNIDYKRKLHVFKIITLILYHIRCFN